jgi:hypothetical protein
MSFHDAASEVSRLNREASARAVAVHLWTYQVLQAAAAMHLESVGVFGITTPLLQKRGLLSRHVLHAARRWACSGRSNSMPIQESMPAR